MYYRSMGNVNYKEDFLDILNPNMSAAWRWTIYIIFIIMVIMVIMCLYNSYKKKGVRDGSVSLFY